MAYSRGRMAFSWGQLFGPWLIDSGLQGIVIVRGIIFEGRRHSPLFEGRRH
jgi:hypothetical protein